MEILISDTGHTATVKLSGRLDILSAENIDLPLATLSGSKKEILVDMAEITFIASIGLRHLVTAAKAIQRRGGNFAWLNPSAAVAEVITTSGLTDLLPIERDVATE
jgi:anti-anti-sigma factor